jgi:hypothetical protein
MLARWRSAQRFLAWKTAASSSRIFCKLPEHRVSKHVRSDVEVEGACYCGKRHEVIFDGAPDWSLLMGERCMDCGLGHTFTQPHEQRNPWRLTGERQVSCALCTQRNAGLDGVRADD